MNPVRVVFASVGGLMLGVLVLLGFAGIGPGTPLQAARIIALEPAQMASADSTIERDGSSLWIVGAPANGISLVMQQVAPFEAREFRHFSLSLAEVAPVLRGALVWRTDGELRALPLPGAFHADTTLDLSRFQEWHGTVDAIGFALMPSDYLAAELTRQRKVEFVQGRLASDSWRGALRALASQWTAYRPWIGRSNHTSGYELASTPGPSLQAFVASLLLVASLAAIVAGGREGLRRAGAIMVCIALGVLVVRQVAQLGLRAQVAVEASARASVRPEWPLAAMPQLAHEALMLDMHLARAPPARVLVWGEEGFTREYPTWLLRRFNAASLHSPSQLGLLPSSGDGSVLVLVGAGGWSHDALQSTLQLADESVSVLPVLEGSLLTAYRLLGTAQ
jgi:hypothetical protein